MATNKNQMALIRRALIAQKLRKAAKTSAQKKMIKQTLDRFTVVAVNLNNLPHDSQGWTATLSRTGTTPITTNFDEFGVARFSTITTLTNFSYTLRIRDADGNLLAQRAVPADLEVFVARFALT